jgi:glycerol-3-phosphate dehydrogenase
LLGARTGDVLGQQADVPELLPDTVLPCAVARWMIRHEWVRHLPDLVERRLMLLYHQRLTLGCLQRLAALMVEEGKLSPAEEQPEVQTTMKRLDGHFAKRVLEA